ncbi:MAG: hypothetical protein JWO60_3128 [Frankiales bacterium]|nr:hypothetical protein [Frankiales bacterium]
METGSPAPPDVKRMRLRRPTQCHACSKPIEAGQPGGWHAASRTTWCTGCLDGTAGSAASPDVAHPRPEAVPTAAEPDSAPLTTEDIAAGVAGGSATAEYERRAAAREARVRAQHPRLGGILLAITPEPQSQRAWKTGGVGEKIVGSRLDDLAGDTVLVLHDRRMRRPDGRLAKSNIDHLVVCPGGVWVIDAKAYDGALEVRRSGGLLSPRVEQLWIAGRNRTTLVTGVSDQANAVTRELAAVAADVPVHAALAFVGTDLPWFGASSCAGVHLLGRRQLNKQLQQPGPLGAAELQPLHRWLAQTFPPAT